MRALLARHPRQRAERRQPVLHAEQIVLGEQQRTDALLVGQPHQPLEREVAGGQVGVDVQRRRARARGPPPAPATRQRRERGQDERAPPSPPSLRERDEPVVERRASRRRRPSVENASARGRAAAPSLARSAGSRPSSMSAAASALASSGGTSRPHSSSTITSGMPPTRVPTTGRPERHGLDEHAPHALVARGRGEHVGGREPRRSRR